MLKTQLNKCTIKKYKDFDSLLNLRGKRKVALHPDPGQRVIEDAAEIGK